MEAVRLESMVENIRDLVYVEFYDVLNEEHFDPKEKQPMENLRLLAHKSFEVKDFPFDSENFCNEYSLLLPIQSTSQVAEFKFNAQFIKAVSPDFMNKPLEDATGYMLQSRIVFTPEFVYSHEKELDKTHIYVKIQNVTQESKELKTRLFFNKEMLPLNQLFIRVGDRLLYSFHVEDRFSTKKEELEPFATCVFEVENERLRKISG